MGVSRVSRLLKKNFTGKTLKLENACGRRPRAKRHEGCSETSGNHKVIVIPVTRNIHLKMVVSVGSFQTFTWDIVVSPHIH